MAEELTPDICVIGAGPGGIAAATAAAAAGAPVVLIERNRPGGNNLTRGTIPSKALLAAASLYETLRVGPSFGVTGAPIQVNLPRVREHILSAIEAIAQNTSAERLTALGVKVVAGSARFANPDLLVAGDTSIRPRRVIIATGSVPALPQVPGLETIESMSLADAFDLTRRPAHLIVLGANRCALEIAQAYARLGIDTTVVDDVEALADDDPELATIVLDRLRAEGIRVRASVKIAEIARRRGGIRVSLTDPVEGEVNVDGSHILIASGRWPDVDGLGLAAAGIQWDTAGIVVDKGLRTTNRRVYAIGDVIAGPALAVRASEQAAAVMRSILYRVPFHDDMTGVPVITGTDPGLASVGLGESIARTRHRDIRVLRFPFAETDRARIEHDPVGMLKVVTTAGGGRVLGAAIVGRDAGELIAPWSLAVANHLGLPAMQAYVPPYPTRSEASRRVAFAGQGDAAAFGREPARLTPEWRRRIIALFRKLG